MQNTKKISAIFLIIASLIGFSQTLYADNGYIRLSDDIRKNPEVLDLLAKNPKKVQILEFFSYACSACARFEPALEHWLDAHTDNATLYRVPVTFSQDEWQSLATLYYVMKELDPKQNLNAKIFQAIHQKGMRLWEETVMQQFFIANGYTKAQFDAAFKKYSNNLAAKKADDLSDIYGINETPSVVVNGVNASYLITADLNDNDYFKVLDQLIKNNQ